MQLTCGIYDAPLIVGYIEGPNTTVDLRINSIIRTY